MERETVDTQALFYEDSAQTEFSARVLLCRGGEAGYDVVLDQTAFYPTGGGQPCDRGTLNGIAVTDVRRVDGIVIHRLEKPLTENMRVEGKVDYARRFDFMQQHTADHILTGVIHGHFGYDNVGFHMGEQSTEIDLNGTMSPAELAEMERVANEVVWMNLPVESSWPSTEKLEKISYRSKKELRGKVRLVTIPGVDICACCGLHTPRTGGVGSIRILSCVPLRGGVRVSILAGRRADENDRRIAEQNRKISVALSAPPENTAAAVEKLRAALRRSEEKANALERQHRADLAQRYAAAGNCVIFEPPTDAVAVRKNAVAVQERCGGIAAVFSGDDLAGYQYAVGTASGDVRALVKAMNEMLNGRGGGRESNFAQGSVRAGRAEIEAWAKEKLNAIVSADASDGEE